MELVVCPVDSRSVIFAGGVLSSSGAKTVKCVTFAVVVFAVVLTVLLRDTHVPLYSLYHATTVLLRFTTEDAPNPSVSEIG